MVGELIQGLSDKISEFFTKLAENVYNGLVWLMQEMIVLLKEFPLVKDTPELYDIWFMLLILSASFITLIIIYLAVKNLCSTGDIVKTVEMKMVFGRLLYTLALILGSLPFIDWLIIFNNLIVKSLMDRFKIEQSLQYISSDNFINNLVAAALIIYQMYLAIKVIIGYWLRVAELHLMTVTSPIMFILWVNPNWGSYLSEWNRRIVSLIFTQFIQVLLMVLYSKMIYRFYENGSLSKLCLAAAFLILMNNTPQFLDKFIARDNAAQIMAKTGRNITGKYKHAASKLSSIKKKLVK